MTNEEMLVLARAGAVKKFETRLNGGNHFSICDVYNYLEDIDVEWHRNEEYQLLSKFHCMSWDDMTPELRNEIVTRCVNYVAAMQESNEHQAKSILQRIFG